MDSREQFENWAKMIGGPKPDLTRANSGLNYADSAIDIAWLAWKASRAAIEIKLTPQPEKVVWGCAGNGPDDYYETIDFARSHDEKSVDGTDAMSIYLDWQVKDALKEAGITVKGE